MSVHITSDNLSKFNKRLHKALKDIVGDNISLSQSAELMARAAGFKTFHDLQIHLQSEGAVPTPNLASTSLPPVLQNPNIAWIEKINADISHYASTHPDSTIRQWSWAKSNGSYSLQIEGDDAAFGLFFGSDVMSYVDKETAHLSATFQDQHFIRELATRFPTDPIEGQKLGLDVAQVCKLPFMHDGWSSIARHAKYTTKLGDFPTYITVSNFGEAIQDFAVIDPNSFVAGVTNSQRNHVDITNLKIAATNIFASWKQAVQYLQEHPNMLLIQRLRQTNGDKVRSSFYATAGQYSVEVKSVNGDDRKFGVGYNEDYGVVRCQGFLAALQKLNKDHNPYGNNEIEHQLWDDGFGFAHTYPLREKFWIKPPR